MNKTVNGIVFTLVSDKWVVQSSENGIEVSICVISEKPFTEWGVYSQPRTRNVTDTIALIDKLTAATELVRELDIAEFLDYIARRKLELRIADHDEWGQKL